MSRTAIAVSAHETHSPTDSNASSSRRSGRAEISPASRPSCSAESAIAERTATTWHPLRLAATRRSATARTPAMPRSEPRPNFQTTRPADTSSTAFTCQDAPAPLGAVAAAAVGPGTLRSAAAPTVSRSSGSVNVNDSRWSASSSTASIPA